MKSRGQPQGRPTNKGDELMQLINSKSLQKNRKITIILQKV